MKKLFYFLLSTFLCMGIVSCDNDEEDDTIYDLELYDRIYTVPIGLTNDIYITTGNRNYLITPEDDQIVTTAYTAGKKEHDRFEIKGLKVGRTSVTVYDQVTGQSQIVTVVVTPMYAALMMAETKIDLKLTDEQRKEEIEKRIKEETLLKHNYEFYMMMDENMDFYLFTRGDQNLEDFMTLEAKGNYQLEEAGEIYHLKVELRDKSYFYELGGRSLQGFKNLWKQAQEISRSSVEYYSLTLREDVTAIYKEEYPELEQAYVTSNPQFYPNAYLPSKVFKE